MRGTDYASDHVKETPRHGVPALSLRVIQDDVEAVDCFQLRPGELLELIVGLQEATLAGIRDAEQAGNHHATLERLHAVWCGKARRPAST